jgi:hypothetical protein
MLTNSCSPAPDTVFENTWYSPELQATVTAAVLVAAALTSTWTESPLAIDFGYGKLAGRPQFPPEVPAPPPIGSPNFIFPALITNAYTKSFSH